MPPRGPGAVAPLCLRLLGLLCCPCCFAGWPEVTTVFVLLPPLLFPACADIGDAKASAIIRMDDRRMVAPLSFSAANNTTAKIDHFQKGPVSKSKGTN